MTIAEAELQLLFEGEISGEFSTESTHENNSKQQQQQNGHRRRTGSDSGLVFRRLRYGRSEHKRNNKKPASLSRRCISEGGDVIVKPLGLERGASVWGRLQQQPRQQSRQQQVPSAMAEIQSPGVLELGAAAQGRILDNLHRLALHLDMDGTLTAAGQPRSPRALDVLHKLQVLGIPVSCNTAQSHEYLLAAGGGVFRACVGELGLRVQHENGAIARTMPPNFGYELEQAKAFLAERPHFPMLLVEKAGGFAFKFSNAKRQRATAEQQAEALALVRSMVAENDELTCVQTDGFVDVCSAVLSKRYGATVQMSQPPFCGCFAVGAGDGVTDERLFEVCDLPIKVGHEPTEQASARLSHHERMLDVLEWIATHKQQQQQQQLQQGRQSQRSETVNNE